MGSPNKVLATYRPDLAGGLEQFDLVMDRNGFIGYQVLPVLEAGEAGGVFGKITLEQLLQNRDTRRAPASGYSRGNWQFTDENYATREYGAEEPIDDNESRVYRNYFDMEQVATARAYDATLRAAEIRCASTLFDTAVWNGAALSTALATPWSDVANATPIDNVEAAVLKVWEASGVWPNALVITRHVFRKLRHNAQIRDRIASSGAGESTKTRRVTVQQLCEVFDLDYIFVAGSAKNAANEGQPRSLQTIWDKSKAMVCRVATTDDLREPCIGRTFHWDGDDSEIGGYVETYRDETVRGDVVRVRHQVHEKVLYKEMGHLLTNVHA